MRTRTVYTHRGDEFELTENEEKFLRALERISKMDTGRLNLMATGNISVRINGHWHDDNIDGSHNINITIDAGDGGDNYV